MARQLRLLPAGMPVHVVQRGVDRSVCFHHETDYLCYVELLTEHMRTFACAVHAYVLMPNHVHLLLTADDDRGVSQLMQRVAQRFTQFSNRLRNRTGTVWDGRFKSSVIGDDAYLLACYRYIELNPVRARLVDHPREYIWSSYRANAESRPSALIQHHPAYIGLATHDGACAAAYRNLFEKSAALPRTDAIRTAVQRGLPLGRREVRMGLSAGEVRAPEQRRTRATPDQSASDKVRIRPRLAS